MTPFPWQKLLHAWPFGHGENIDCLSTEVLLS